MTIEVSLKLSIKQIYESFWRFPAGQSESSTFGVQSEWSVGADPQLWLPCSQELWGWEEQQPTPQALWLFTGKCSWTKNNYSQTCPSGHLSIAVTYFMRPLKIPPPPPPEKYITVFQKDPVNTGHLSIIATVLFPLSGLYWQVWL